MCKLSMLAFVSAVAFTSAAFPSAQAADVPETAPYDWTGFYLGGHVGYGEAYFSGGLELEEDEPPDTPEFARDLDVNGFAFGGHVGYNHQLSPMFVLGIEADATFVDWDDTVSSFDGVDIEGISAEVDLLASVRGRAGIAMDRVLIYATGGVAFTDAKFTAFEIGEFSESVDFDDIGGVVGGGVEYAFVDSISFRAEGLYYIFNDKHNLNEAEDGDFGKFDDAFVVRAGVSWYPGK